jgi:hypothetical protein
MNNEEQFLKAEETANLLTDSLERLKAEMESYRSAASHLETAAAAVTGLAERVTAVAQNVQEGLESIRSAGGPEILNRIDAARKEIEQSSEGSAKRLELLPGIAGGVAAVEQLLHGSEEALSGHIDSVPSGTVKAMQPSFDSMAHDVRTLRLLVILGLLASLAALILGVVRLFATAPVP